MAHKLKYFDYIYETHNCWTFKDFNELHIGSDNNTSGILRFTSLIYVKIYSILKNVQKIILNLMTNSGTVVLILIFCERSPNI
jgi:hypothetical protein